MIRVSRSATAAALTAVFFLAVLLIAGTRLVGAEPKKSNKSEQIEHRTINRLVKDFPEKTDLSTPESAMAAYYQSTARKDIPAALDLSWVKLDAESAKDAAKDFEKHLPENFGQQVLDTEIVEVLTYSDDLAAVIIKSGLLPPGRQYAAQHFWPDQGPVEKP